MVKGHLMMPPETNIKLNGNNMVACIQDGCKMATSDSQDWLTRHGKAGQAPKANRPTLTQSGQLWPKRESLKLIPGKSIRE